MAEPTTRPYVDGALTGTIYTFAAAGDTLPLHDHPPEAAHISIVTRGAFTVSGPGWSKVVVPGPIQSFNSGQPHEFVAAEPGSVVVNILKGSSP